MPHQGCQSVRQRAAHCYLIMVESLARSHQGHCECREEVPGEHIPLFDVHQRRPSEKRQDSPRCRLKPSLAHWNQHECWSLQQLPDTMISRYLLLYQQSDTNCAREETARVIVSNCRLGKISAAPFGIVLIMSDIFLEQAMLKLVAVTSVTAPYDVRFGTFGVCNTNFPRHPSPHCKTES